MMKFRFLLLRFQLYFLNCHHHFSFILYSDCMYIKYEVRDISKTIRHLNQSVCYCVVKNQHMKIFLFHQLQFIGRKNQFVTTSHFTSNKCVTLAASATTTINSLTVESNFMPSFDFNSLVSQHQKK